MDELLTVNEVSKILKVNVSTVHSLRKSGLIPFMKLGVYKCRRVTLEKFLADHDGEDLTGYLKTAN
jgi:excisionase family DNA binding protein